MPEASETHAAHSWYTGSLTAGAFLLRNFGNHSLGRNHQTGNRRRILQSCSDNLGRINNTSFDHINIFTCLGIITKVAIIAF